MLAKVAGGTGAGRKMGTVKQERKWPWTCANRHRNPAYAVTCLRDGCREKRRG